MLNGSKLRCGLAADALRGRISGYDLGVRLLERGKLAQQPIVFGVRHLRIVEHVVAVVQRCELRAQLVGALHGGESAAGGLVRRKLGAHDGDASRGECIAARILQRTLQAFVQLARARQQLFKRGGGWQRPGQHREDIDAAVALRIHGGKIKVAWLG